MTVQEKNREWASPPNLQHRFRTPDDATEPAIDNRAFFIVKLAMQGKTVKEIMKSTVDSYEGDHTEIESDVVEFLNKLRDKQVIEIARAI